MPVDTIPYLNPCHFFGINCNYYSWQLQYWVNNAFLDKVTIWSNELLSNASHLLLTRYKRSSFKSYSCWLCTWQNIKVAQLSRSSTLQQHCCCGYKVLQEKKNHLNILGIVLATEQTAHLQHASVFRWENMIKKKIVSIIYSLINNALLLLVFVPALF